MTSPPASPSSGWGSESQIASARRWHENARAAGQGLTDVLLARADLRPGLRVLDVACGAGAPALDEARRVGPQGHVIGVDASEPALGLAQQYAREEGLSNVEFRLADAQALPFPDRSFDRVTSRFGAMFFADLPKALHESRRVLRPGGRLVWLVWGTIEQPFFQSTVRVAMRHAAIRELPVEAAQPFCFGVGGLLSRALHSAGFDEVKETEHEVPFTWPGSAEDLSEYWWTPVAPPFQSIADRLTPEARDQARSEVTEKLRAFYADGQVRLTTSVILATGSRDRTP